MLEQIEVASSIFEFPEKIFTRRSGVRSNQPKMEMPPSPVAGLFRNRTVTSQSNRRKVVFPRHNQGIAKCLRNGSILFMRVWGTHFRGMDHVPRTLIRELGIISAGIVLCTPIELKAAGTTNEPVMTVLTNGVAQLDAAVTWLGFKEATGTPDLLHLANLAGMVVYIAYFGSKFLQLRRADSAPLSENCFAIAAMTGGAQRVAQAAITSLARNGNIILGGPNGVAVIAMGPLQSEVTDLERAVYNTLSESDGIRVLDLVDKVKGLTAVQEIVWKTPPVADRSRVPFWVRLPFSLLYLLAFALVGYRLYRHYEDGSAWQDWYHGWGQVASMGAWAYLMSFFPWKNDRWMSSQKRLSDRLKKAYPDIGGALTAHADHRDWAMAVAVHGPYALSGTPLADYVVQFGYSA